MVNWLIHTDTAWLLAVNGFHAPWADTVMWIVSGKLIWIPLYALLLWMLWREFGKQVWRTLILTALLIVCTDQGAGFAKNTVKRPRPTHNPDIEATVHVVNDYRGGHYGFFSSHAANTFGIALFTGLLLRRRYKKILPALLLWATLVSYSRIYLGVHYPLDILAGAIWGSVCGLTLATVHKRWLPRKIKFRLNR